MSSSQHTSQNPTSLPPFLLGIILMLMLLMQTTTDLYLPSLPAIRKTFGSDEPTIQLTFSLFFLGLSLSHLFYGPLSDRIGRKPPLLLGVALSAAGSLICLFSSTPTALIIGRFFQGFGIGCCNSVGRSLARDLLSKTMLAYIGSYIGMISVVIMALSPTLGGYIQEYLGWRFGFLILCIFSCTLWLLMWIKLPETNQYLDPKATKIPIMLTNYFKIITNKTFLGHTLCACFAFSGLVSYFTISPFLIQDVMGFTPVQFGLQTFFIAGAIFLSGLINSLLVLKKGIHFMILVGIGFMISGASIMILVTLFHLVNIYSLIAAIIFFSIGAGLTFINAFAGAFDPFPKIAGTVGALYATLQDLSAGLTCGFIAIFKHNSSFVLGTTLLIFAICSMIAWRVISPIQTTWNNQEVINENNG